MSLPYGVTKPFCVLSHLTTGAPFIMHISLPIRIIVTTNLPFSEWTTLFEYDAMIAAMVDRLTFQPYIFDMNGMSCRLVLTKKLKM